MGAQVTEQGRAARGSGLGGAAARGSGRRPKGALTRDGVARAALELLDRDGLDALSMRRLADELGAGTMTLYGYFRNKDELLDAVIDAGFDDFEPPPPAPTPLEGVRDLTLASRAVLLRHPALVEIRGTRPIVRPRWFQITERVIDLLTQAGFEPGEAARAFRLLFEYVFGYSIVNRRPPSPELRREALASIVALDPEEFPFSTSVAEDIADAVAGGEQFEYGLDRILDGLAARQAVIRAGTTSSRAAPAAGRRRTGPRAR